MKGARYKTKEYQEYINSDRWKSLRKHIIKRDNNRCQRCYEKFISLDVHHLSYDNFGNEFFGELVCLCRECHTKTHLSEDIKKDDEDIIRERAKCSLAYNEFGEDNRMIVSDETHSNFLERLEFVAKLIGYFYDGFISVKHCKGSLYIYPIEATRVAYVLFGRNEFQQEMDIYQRDISFFENNCEMSDVLLLNTYSVDDPYFWGLDEDDFEHDDFGNLIYGELPYIDDIIDKYKEDYL